MNQLRVLWTYFRLGTLNELAYRVNFYTQLLSVCINLVFSLGALAIVFNQTDTLAGWYPTELIALVGIYILVGGLINLVIQPSMNRFMEDIRMGTLDFMILKPEDAQAASELLSEAAAARTSAKPAAIGRPARY